SACASGTDSVATLGGMTSAGASSLSYGRAGSVLALIMESLSMVGVRPRGVLAHLARPLGGGTTPPRIAGRVPAIEGAVATTLVHAQCWVRAVLRPEGLGLHRIRRSGQRLQYPVVNRAAAPAMRS